jgi:hypothetical protein
VETNGNNYVAVQHADSMLSNVKVIQIVRDPRDFVTSMINWRRRNIKFRIMYNITPYWDISAPLVGEMSRAQWRALGELGRFAWQWKFKNSLIKKLYSANSERYLLIRFEDIFNSGLLQQKLQEILSFMSLDYYEDMIKHFSKPQNKSAGNYIAGWRDWSREDCKMLENICGPLMKIYNYGEEKEWQEKLS